MELDNFTWGGPDSKWATENETPAYRLFHGYLKVRIPNIYIDMCFKEMYGCYLHDVKTRVVTDFDKLTVPTKENPFLVDRQECAALTGFQTSTVSIKFEELAILYGIVGGEFEILSGKEAIEAFDIISAYLELWVEYLRHPGVNVPIIPYLDILLFDNLNKRVYQTACYYLSQVVPNNGLSEWLAGNTETDRTTIMLRDYYGVKTRMIPEYISPLTDLDPNLLSEIQYAASLSKDELDESEFSYLPRNY